MKVRNVDVVGGDVYVIATNVIMGVGAGGFLLFFEEEVFVSGFL